ncbi:hypothetical protein EVAR_97497_1 [Eumeta japonica]|uniref:Uncharacterized protein n=1 Tax=Eumeta variegata TaxID=151549 RepID=A0A4C1T0F4_EUMVA|nr:hypothetical protein EVAR_97497_1 [Eumeta japonica]
MSSKDILMSSVNYECRSFFETILYFSRQIPAVHGPREMEPQPSDAVHRPEISRCDCARHVARGRRRGQGSSPRPLFKTWK